MSAANLEVLKQANFDVTQEALVSNVTTELQQTADAETAKQLEAWEAAQKKAQVEEEEDDDDMFGDDKVLEELTQKRLADLKSRANLEKQFHAQGHGEYREIVEEEFLKEVCGSQYVVVHFYHPEFFRCKIIDKHMRILAPKYLSCKWLTLNVEKAPFFVTKLHIQMLPTVIVFKDGIVVEQLVGLDELGGKDDFRTEVLELWLSKQGCIIIKNETKRVAEAGSDEDESGDSDFD